MIIFICCLRPWDSRSTRNKQQMMKEDQLKRRFHTTQHRHILVKMVPCKQPLFAPFVTANNHGQEIMTGHIKATHLRIAHHLQQQQQKLCPFNWTRQHETVKLINYRMICINSKAPITECERIVFSPYVNTSYTRIENVVF